MPGLYYRDTTSGTWMPVSTAGPSGPTGPAGPVVEGVFWEKWTGTQAEYDALGTYDEDVLYVIVG